MGISESRTRSRLGSRQIWSKVISIVATLSLVASMCPGTVALAYANESFLAGSARSSQDDSVQLADSTSISSTSIDSTEAGSFDASLSSAEDSDVSDAARWTKLDASLHELSSGAYNLSASLELNKDKSNDNALVINGKVLIYIPKDVELEVWGKDAASTQDVGKAAILLPEGSSLTVTGGGTLRAHGGKAGSGEKGKDASGGRADAAGSTYTGNGGDGGNGGGGAGAGIGTNGGQGGSGGKGGAGVKVDGGTTSVHRGKGGASGSAGQQAETPGTFFVAGSNLKVSADGGASGQGGSTGGASSRFYSDYNFSLRSSCKVSAGGSGGGGAGGGGTAGFDIGYGGTGGAGGGGGASGSINGVAVLSFSSSINLYGGGGKGGNSDDKSNPGKDGADGSETNSTSNILGAAGGSGGECVLPTPSTYYAYKTPESSATSSPESNKASFKSLDDIDTFMSYGGYTTSVVIDGNHAMFAGATKRTTNVVPGATTVKELSEKFLARVTPERLGYTWVGYGLTSDDDDEETGVFCRMNTGGKLEWPKNALDVLVNKGLISNRELENTSTPSVWTGLDSILYAKWNEIKYTITYDKNSAPFSAQEKVKPCWWSIDTKEKENNSEIKLKEQYGYSAEVTLWGNSNEKSTDNQTHYLADVNSNGDSSGLVGLYRHIGWTTEVDSVGQPIGQVFRAGDTVKGLSAVDGETVTLHAVWLSEGRIAAPIAKTSADLYPEFGYSNQEFSVQFYPVKEKVSNSSTESYYYPLLRQWKLETGGRYEITWEVSTDEGTSWNPLSADEYEPPIQDDSAFNDYYMDNSKEKAGHYDDSAFISTLKVPEGLGASQKRLYRATYSLYKNQDLIVSQTTTPMLFECRKASYDEKEISVTGGSYIYDGNPHAAVVKVPRLGGSQSLFYVVSYAPEGSEEFSNDAPIEPGVYTAKVEFNSVEIFNGNMNEIEPYKTVITIKPKQVEQPTASNLVFALDPETGQGVEQDAFPGVDDNKSIYEFVSSAENVSPTLESKRCAANVGSYRAHFKLKDPSRYQWVGKSKGEEDLWIDWSISSASIDPNDPSKIYWGETPNNENYTFTFEDKSVHYVRPWFAQNREKGGEFPEALTYWVNNSPALAKLDLDNTDDRKKISFVAYKQEGEDSKAVVGYHREDESLTEVTADSLELWRNGYPAVNGELVYQDPESEKWKYASNNSEVSAEDMPKGEPESVTLDDGDIVWVDTETGRIIQVGGENEPAGSAVEKIVVHDFNYIDYYGVMHAGTYTASTYFNGSSGLQAMSAAQHIVIIKQKEVPKIYFTTDSEKQEETSQVPKPYYFNNGEREEGLPNGVKKVTFYEHENPDSSWGSYSKEGAIEGGQIGRGDWNLIAKFEMESSDYQQVEDGVITFSIVTGQLQIEKAHVVLKKESGEEEKESNFSPSFSVTYDGDSRTVTLGTQSVIKDDNGNLVKDYTTRVIFFKNDDLVLGEDNMPAQYVSEAGEYEVGLVISASGHLSAQITVHLTVESADLDDLLDKNKVTLDTLSTYDGKVHELKPSYQDEKGQTIEGLPQGVGGEEITWVVTDNDNPAVHAGSYKKKVQFSCKNYKESQEYPYTLTIDKQELNLPERVARVYNGQEQSPFKDNEDLSGYVVDGAKTRINAGKYEVVLTIKNQGDFKIPSELPSDVKSDENQNQLYLPWSIEPADFNMQGVKFESKTYDFDSQNPKKIYKLEATDIPEGLKVSYGKVIFGEGENDYGGHPIKATDPDGSKPIQFGEEGYDDAQYYYGTGGNFLGVSEVGYYRVFARFTPDVASNYNPIPDQFAVLGVVAPNESATLHPNLVKVPMAQVPTYTGDDLTSSLYKRPEGENPDSYKLRKLEYKATKDGSYTDVPTMKAINAGYYCMWFGDPNTKNQNHLVWDTDDPANIAGYDAGDLVGCYKLETQIAKDSIDVQSYAVSDSTLTYDGKPHATKLNESAQLELNRFGVGVGYEYYRANESPSINPSAVLAVGEYRVDVTYTLSAESATNYQFSNTNENETKTSAAISISKIKVSLPKAIEGLKYNGELQTGIDYDDRYSEPSIRDDSFSSAIIPGSYTATCKMKDECQNYAEWEDGTTAPKTIQWSIAKATYSWAESAQWKNFDTMMKRKDGTHVEFKDNIDVDTPDETGIDSSNGVPKTAEWEYTYQKKMNGSPTFSEYPKEEGCFNVEAKFGDRYHEPVVLRKILVHTNAALVPKNMLPTLKHGNSITYTGESLEGGFIGLPSGYNTYYSLPDNYNVLNFATDCGQYECTFTGTGYVFPDLEGEGSISNRFTSDNYTLSWEIKKADYSWLKDLSVKFSVGSEEQSRASGETYETSYADLSSLSASLSKSDGIPESSNWTWVCKHGNITAFEGQPTSDNLKKLNASDMPYVLQGTYKGDANHNDAFIEVYLQISKAPVKIPEFITESAGSNFVTYNGTLQTPFKELDTNRYIASGVSGINAGEYTAEFTLKDTTNYTFVVENEGSIGEKATVKWSITPQRKELGRDITFKDKSVTYDGLAHSLTVSADDIQWLKEQGIEVSYDNNNLINAGTYTIRASFAYKDTNFVPAFEGGSGNVNYMEATLTILRQTIKKSDEPQIVSGLIYNASPQLGFKANTQYYSIKDGLEPQVNAGSYQTHFEPWPNYAWSDGSTNMKSLTWVILPQSVDRPNTTIEPLVYNGMEQTLPLSVLTDSRYAVTGQTKATVAGEYTATLVLNDKNNYVWAATEDESANANDLTIKWEIGKKPVEAPTLQTTRFDYTGANVSPELQLPDDGSWKISEGSTTSAKDAGAYKVIVELTYPGNTAWEDTKTSEPREIEWYIGKQYVDPPTWETTEFTYNGSEQRVLSAPSEDTSLWKFADNTTKAATNAGNYTTTIELTDPNNMAWRETKDANPIEIAWRINKTSVDVSNVKFDNVRAIYDGKPHSVAVKNLPEGVNVTYHGTRTLTNQGESMVLAELSVDENGNYDKLAGSSKITAILNVSAANINKATVIAPKQTYTGSALKPKPTVKLNGKELKETADYIVTWENNINAGKASITVVGQGNYTGVASGSFDIAPIRIESVSLDRNTFTYSGEEQLPSVTAYSKSGVVPESEYIVSTRSSMNAGTYDITVIGQGNYTGTITRTYTIRAASNKFTKLKSVTKKLKAKSTKQTFIPFTTSAKTPRFNNTKISFAKVKKGSSKKLSINKETGKITLAKKAKAGTYKIKVKVKAAVIRAKNSYTVNVKATSKIVTITVKVSGKIKKSSSLKTQSSNGVLSANASYDKQTKKGIRAISL